MLVKSSGKNTAVSVKYVTNYSTMHIPVIFVADFQLFLCRCGTRICRLTKAFVNILKTAFYL